MEAFDRILIESKTPADFRRGLERFVPKEDLDPFAQTKFLGHNAIHAMLGYLAKDKGITFMHEVGEDSNLMEKAKEAFLDEAGIGLINEYADVEDELFSCSRFPCLCGGCAWAHGESFSSRSGGSGDS